MTFGRREKMLTGLCLAALALAVRLFQIQVLDNGYKEDAGNISLVRVPVYPTRGRILDRQGRVLAGNRMCYDIMVYPKGMPPFDTSALASLLAVEPDYVREKMAEYARYRTKIGYKSVTFLRQVPSEQYLRFAEHAYRFPGFFGQPRSIRQYPFNAGGNLLGYVSEVDPAFLKRHEGLYRPGDYTGRTGIEEVMEETLRGSKGERIYVRNHKNQIEGSFKDGWEDIAAIPGNDVTTTIDAELQQYGQTLMEGKVGSIVAIEPSSGEILSLVSSPGINVDQLSDLGRHYGEIVADPYKPMFNRAVQASYPPGSVFKLVNCLIGLQEGAFKPSTCYPCYHGYVYGSHVLGCHWHRSPLDMESSLMMSCNAYYCYVFKGILENCRYPSVEAAFDKWNDYVRSFGFGEKLGTDIPAELAGNIPTSRYYDRIYGSGRWRANTIISLSIGQGEIGCTPMHLANLCATIANRGWYITPHLIKYTDNGKYTEKHYTMVDTCHFAGVVNGMYKAVNSGYGSGATASIAAVPGLDICGKTGTAQNPHGDDHSVFVCFAPRDNPRIAVLVYVENGGFGAAWAAPIASLMVEKYLTGGIGTNRAWLEGKVKDGRLIDRTRYDE